AVSASDFTVGSNDSVVCTITNTRKEGTLQVVKHLVPADDTGTFNLLVDDATKATGGDGADTGALSESPYSDHSVGESAGAGTDLSDYAAQTSCTRNGQAIENLDTAHISVGSQDAVVCTISNTLIPINVDVAKSGPDLVHDGDVISWDITVTNP